MPTPDRIKQLIETFDQNINEYHFRKMKLSCGEEFPGGELLQRQITSTDRQIDELVYQLYGLSEEEQKLVKTDHEMSSVQIERFLC